MREIILVAHDIRSANNVGSLLRTADGLGLHEVILTGYTPYPIEANDSRLPHLANKIHRQITKTSLGAEQTVSWQHIADLSRAISGLRKRGFLIIALEQSKDAKDIRRFMPSGKLAVMVGNEVTGLDDEALSQADKVVEIKMLGAKESFNVAIAAAIALYHLKFIE